MDSNLKRILVLSLANATALYYANKLIPNTTGSDLKRIILISAVNGVTLYYTNKLLSNTKILQPNETSQKIQ
ncbi:MAG: hypothetical protein ACM31G_09670 [Flavobacteriales bacterium]